MTFGSFVERSNHAAPGFIASRRPPATASTSRGPGSEVNTASLDGCPIQSPDGLSLYLASNRPGGRGGLDIWVATRPTTGSPWGAPQNLGEPVNSAADDFCPTPVRGGGLFFVSREALPGSCGLGDIYFTRQNPRHGWSEPVHLGCAPDGPNSALDEQGPSLVEIDGQAMLFFSRSSPTVAGEIYVSSALAGGGFGPASAVTELNDATANDIQPNVRKDGLEIVFDSDRPCGFGGFDIYRFSECAGVACVDVIAPNITQSQFLFQTAPIKLAFTFSEDVSDSLSVADIVISRIGGGNVTPSGLSYDELSNVATFTLPTPLADGNYLVSFASGSVTDPAGNPLSPNHPWNKQTIPKPQSTSWKEKYSWSTAPRWDRMAMETGPYSRIWANALADDYSHLKLIEQTPDFVSFVDRHLERGPKGCSLVLRDGLQKTLIARDLHDFLIELLLQALTISLIEICFAQ